MLSGVSPIWIPRLCLQCIAAPLGGASATVLTTPLDAIRARIQVITLVMMINIFIIVIVIAACQWAAINNNLCYVLLLLFLSSCFIFCHLISDVAWPIVTKFATCSVVTQTHLHYLLDAHILGNAH